MKESNAIKTKKLTNIRYVNNTKRSLFTRSNLTTFQIKSCNNCRIFHLYNTFPYFDILPKTYHVKITDSEYYWVFFPIDTTGVILSTMTPV